MGNDGGEPVRLSDVLRQYVASAGLARQAVEHMIPLIWPQVVGEWYARHTRVVRVWDGTVEVLCDSAARAQQLQLDSPEIIRRLNQRLGEQYVRQIRPGTSERLQPAPSRLGRPRVWTAVPTERELAGIELSPEDEHWIAACAAQIEDPVARETFQRAARSHLKLRAWKLAHGWMECPKCKELYPPGTECIGCRAQV
ncbi:MAG: DUF721 domain-containing protein [Armatimonadetes bacterium]|nr:DUF721 domain-containing protein [Armatimonadota bacterium]